MGPDVVARQCNHDVGCITCGDTAVRMRVVAVDEERGLALCADGEGARETVETALVEPVEQGATVLVHAAVAIQVVDSGEAGAASVRDATVGAGAAE